MGGVGKTALLAYWVKSRFNAKGWVNEAGQPDPVAYFDWTFYDQGTRSDDATQAGAASLGSFFHKALEHFGDPDPENPQRKVARLAELIQSQRTLLILDGLEPLQYPPNHAQAGQLTDPDLRELLGLLAQRNPGLCLISSRQVLTDFPSAEASPTRQHDLEELPVEVAVSLLRKMQVIGTDDELREAANDYFCHALSLTVLGRFLFVKGGDIRIRKQIPLERANDNRNQRITRNAWHVLEAYEAWLASPQGKVTDAQALRLTGLFDRPASADCLAALRQAPAIPGLTDALVPLDDDAWNSVLLRLHDAHLIQLRFPLAEKGSFAPHPEPRQVPVDAHPLIREYFAKQLRHRGIGSLPVSPAPAEGPRAWETAHSRLFDHLCENTPHQPDTLEGLQPLYQAVVHGCLAGRQQEACDKVYFDRILRGGGDDGYYSTKKLGAIGADLGAVAAFFDVPWSRLSPNLSEADQAWLLNEAAFRLRALGRLTEAREPMRAGLEMRINQGVWKSAAIIVSNLSELEVTLGLLGEAVASARRAVDFADQSGDAFWRLVNRTTAADALHQSGAPAERAEALALFKQAETLQREFQPELPLLYSLAGFRYCDLILAPAERAAWKAVLDRRGSVLEPKRSERSQPEEAARRASKTRQCGGKRSATPLSDARGNLADSGVSSGGREVDLTVVGESLGAAKAVSAPLQGSATAFQDAAALEDAEHRAAQALEWENQYKLSLFSIALDHLILARVALYRALLDPQRPAAIDPQHSTAALDGLRKSNIAVFLPLALLSAALQHHFLGDPAAAIRYLAEAQQIAERGPMPLYLADVHLHRARLVGSMADAAARERAYPGVDPHAELAKARALITKHRYGRRTEELADAEAAAAGW